MVQDEEITTPAPTDNVAEESAGDVDDVTNADITDADTAADAQEQTSADALSDSASSTDGTDEQPDGAVVDSVSVGDESDTQDNVGDDDLRLFADGPAASSDKAGEEDGVSLAALEAFLFSTSHPLTAGNLGQLLDLPSTKPIRRAIKALNDDYESTGRTFRIEQVAGGYQMLTLPEFGDTIKKLHQNDADAKLSKAALETLAIVAYKQPILRVDVEGIRGVACGETIRNLMEKHLVKIAGRAEEPGRPILYGTTKRFLEVFGLNSLNDLPNPDAELRPKAKPQPAEVAAESSN